MERWLEVKSEEMEKLYSYFRDIRMAWKLQYEVELLLPGWNSVGLLKTYSTMSPHTHSLQPSAPAKIKWMEQSGAERRFHSQVLMKSLQGDWWGFVAEKLHSTCQPGEMGEDVLLLSQQLQWNPSPQMNLFHYSLILILMHTCWVRTTLHSHQIFLLGIRAWLFIALNRFLQSDTVTGNPWTLTCHNFIFMKCAFAQVVSMSPSEALAGTGSGWHTQIKWKAHWGVSLMLLIYFSE